jgi:hypothetical protein
VVIYDEGEGGRGRKEREERSFVLLWLLCGSAEVMDVAECSSRLVEWFWLQQSIASILYYNIEYYTYVL